MNHSSFTQQGSRRIESLNLEFQSYRHSRTGARHLHLACDDDNNAFMVAFPTIPEDSTGVAHILEHTTLCGSERYPVRDPFFMMLRRSLNTFMNAFTSSDSTAYPFATRNRKDFDNLLAVYLDAVFFPKLDPLDFAQEGYRVELADDNASEGVVYKGVVFNEMKGAMSSPVSQLWHHLQAALFPNAAYRFNSGGDPATIPQLTHQRLKAFHARHYHPSQAVFLTYGNYSPQDHQAQFEALALARFEASTQIIVSGLQPRVNTPRAATVTYAVEQAADAIDATHIVWGWLLDETGQPRTMLEAQLLTGVLLEHSASPLRHYLETTQYAKAPSELCGVDDSARQLAFYCGVEGSDPRHAIPLEEEILALLAQIGRDGVPPAVLHAALDKIEMAQRDISGDHYPYGLQLMSRALPGAMYRSDPVALLDIDSLLAELRQEILDPAYFKRLVAEMLVDNQHRVRVVMTPDSSKRKQDQDDERARLKALFNSLSDADKADLARQAEALSSRQARRDDPDILPKITLADVPASAAPITGQVETINGRRVHAYRRGTNGLVHAQIAFDLPALTAEELALLPLFSAYLLEFGAGRETYLETQTRRSQFGHFAASSVVRSQVSDLAQHHAQFVVSAKGLRRHTSALLATVDEIIAAARFDEADRLMDLLTQTRADLELGISERGHQLAMHSAARGLSKSGWLSDEWDGPSNIRQVQRLEALAGTDPASLQRLFATFDKLRQRLVPAQRQVLLVGEEESLALARDALQVSAPSTPTTNAPGLVIPDPPPARATAWLANADVNFCAKAYPAVPEGHADAAALAVLGRYLSDGFLHPAIREKGGAYGGGASFDSDSGCFFFYSYRDPRLTETLADFDRARDWFASTNDALRLEESILGVIRALDKPRSPAGAAIDAFYSQQQGRTPEFRARFRGQVLGITYQDLTRVVSRYLSGHGGSVSVVTHPGERATIDALGMHAETL